jgi:hypothetical protein
MLDNIEPKFPISAVLIKRPSPNQWTTASWSLLGTVPGLSDSQINQALEQGGELHIIADLTLHLYVKHCDAYYINLTSQQPKVYFACQDLDDEIKPILMTVDFDEAAALMETGERVLEAPLSESLCLWLEKFVLAYYQPEKLKKRRRTQWHKREGSL